VRPRVAVPVISTADVRATIDHYVSVLGFDEHFSFGEPVVYAGVERDGVELYITLDVPLATMLRDTGLHPELFLWVDDVDAVYADHTARGATIAEQIGDRAWEARQYVVEDPNGYRIKFAQPLDELR
jgi:catechol 2,3-dioxygenase-like lactoylglutathione lyase family enzyme